MKVIVCNCNPEAHKPITSTNTKLLRRVRRDTLQRADRYEAEGDTHGVAICARYSAHLYLLRLRELANQRK